MNIFYPLFGINDQMKKTDSTAKLNSNLISDVIVNDLCLGNYDDALKFINERLAISSSDQDAVLELLELKNIILRLRLKAEGNCVIGPTASSATLPNSFTYEMLDIVQKVMRCKTHYEVLRVSHEATFCEVKRAYKKLAVRLHPDKNQAPLAEEAFRRISVAADVLTDSQKRVEYNMDIATNEKLRKCRVNQHNSHNINDMSECDEEYIGDNCHKENEIKSQKLEQELLEKQREPYKMANQRTLQSEYDYKINHILFCILISIGCIVLVTYYFESSQLYSFEANSFYSVRRVTHRYAVPYYVTENFNDVKTIKNVQKFETEIENTYIFMLKKICQQEQSQRGVLLARATQTGDRKLKTKALKLSMPSCSTLTKFGEPRYKLLQTK